MLSAVTRCALTWSFLCSSVSFTCSDWFPHSVPTLNSCDFAQAPASSAHPHQTPQGASHLLHPEGQNCPKQTPVPTSLSKNLFLFLFCLSVFFSEKETCALSIRLRLVTLPTGLCFFSLSVLSPPAPPTPIPVALSAFATQVSSSSFLLPLLFAYSSLCLEHHALSAPDTTPATDALAHQLIYIHPQVSSSRSLFLLMGSLIFLHSTKHTSQLHLHCGFI